LRGEGGCPWDREQTHATIRRNLIEECYEAVEAIDEASDEKLADELGDVLLQVVFHAQIGKDEDAFDIGDVLYNICAKMIRRHPHIFGDASADTSEQVLTNWEAIKREEKAISSHSQALADVTKALPALIRAEKVQAKAKKAGFDWENAAGALAKVREELNELAEAVESGAASQMEEELGDLLFVAVNVSRFLKIDAEGALSHATEKFIRRFSEMESLADAKGQALETLSPAEMDKLWETVKKEEN
jgi:tetrapyrrole methylase family protein/MazG family protein